jgi:hypothetical protein
MVKLGFVGILDNISRRVNRLVLVMRDLFLKKLYLFEINQRMIFADPDMCG